VPETSSGARGDCGARGNSGLSNRDGQGAGVSGDRDRSDGMQGARGAVMQKISGK